MYDEPPFEELQQTQEDEPESTQPASQDETNDDIWAYLSPCSPSLNRTYLYKDALAVTIGRSPTNSVVFPGFKISNFHATIRWNGEQNAASVVTIEDTSSNGTFINQEKIGKGQQRLLKDGNEIAFGVAGKSTEQNGLYDYRFIFRDLVSGVVKRALYSSYDISSELGKGSFATVYKALHIASGEWVAVKVIHETKRQNPSPNTPSEVARQSSSREINIMETLHHPNICQLREVFWNANGSIDLVLELIEGGDLLDYILQHNGLSESSSKHITYELCQALAYIHDKGITHRDLKPENVLLTKDNPPRVKVADFGLAKIVDSMTMLKTMCGTPSYLAPEVVTQQNSSGYDSLVDSWSVGVILFSMLTNTTPFIESSVADLRTRIASRDIDWAQLETLGLTEEAVDFIRLLLEYDPRNRMTLRDALQHPWLLSYQSADSPVVNGANVSNGNLNGEDVSMRTADGLSFSEAEAVSQGFEHLKLNGSTSGAAFPEVEANAAAAANGHAAAAGAGGDQGRLTPPSNTPPGLTLHKKGALMRRSEVLAHAAETGRPLVEPSWEMVSFAQSQSQADSESEALYGPPAVAAECAAATATVTANVPTQSATQPGTANGDANGRSGSGSGSGKGPNKRVHSELTPLPEEMEGADGDGVVVDGVSGGSSPLSSVGDSPPPPAGPLKKKGRSAESRPEETPSKTQGRAKRGAKAAAPAPASARKVRARVDSTAAEEPVGTRRSTRSRSKR
ncbi:kinase-like domain-containing protein [Mycena capillaripes]|nr:kinase-like domain-containing protein [Mycena capillaripes]